MLSKNKIINKKIENLGLNMNLTTISNIAFLAPIYCSYKAKAYSSTLIYGMTFIASFLYHNSHETQFENLDRLLAKFACIHSLLIWLSYHVDFHSLSFISNNSKNSIICAAIGVGVYLMVGRFRDFDNHHYSNYTLGHSLWHVMGAISGTLLFC